MQNLVGQLPQKNNARATGRWWLLPQLAFVLFVVVVGSLLWLTERAEHDKQRTILINDVLWLEQNLRFQFVHNEERLGQIGLLKAASNTAFENNARTLLAANNGLRQIVWLDADGKLRQSFPPTSTRQAAEATSGQALSPETTLLAKAMGEPVYSAAYFAPGNDWQFEVHVPIVHDGRIAGTVVGIYSIRHLLEDSVPWWLAERYQIAVADESGVVLGINSRIQAVLDGGSYDIPLDPPGHGLILKTMPYQTSTPLVGRLLSVALVFLAALVLWSLWALKRHVQRRLTTEEALRNEHAFRKAMEDSLQTGLRARDMAGRITYVNPAFCAMVGWGAEELVGHMPPMPYWAEEEKETAQAMSDLILAGQGPNAGYEILYRRRNGETFPALVHTAPLIDADGTQTGWMSSIVDITEQKHAAEQARQQQERLQTTTRLVTMGEMASSLAHELNQPLAAIASYNTGCLNLLSNGQVDLKDIEEAIRKSADQAQRAGRIIRRIYEFVRRAEPKWEPVDIHRLLEEVIGFVEADARRKKVQLTLTEASDLPTITGDRVLLTQATLNLVRNGIDAAREGDGSHAVDIQARREGQNLLLRIVDTGPGISPELEARLFEPFHTTKAEGMGMGLNICRSVIEAHHGRLWYEPNPDGGSVFQISLPLSPT